MFCYVYWGKSTRKRQQQRDENKRENNKLMNIYSEAILMEGNKEVSRRTLTRLNIANNSGRKDCGRFTEEI